MNSSFKARAVAMLASVATTFVLFQAVAMIGHPARAPVTTAQQGACTIVAGAAS